jgi:hypothetical protein
VFCLARGGVACESGARSGGQCRFRDCSRPLRHRLAHGATASPKASLGRGETVGPDSAHPGEVGGGAVLEVLALGQAGGEPGSGPVGGQLPLDRPG